MATPGDDADEYVQVIMSSQLLSRVESPPISSGRKRNRSEPCVSEFSHSIMKKQKVFRKLYNEKHDERTHEQSVTIVNCDNDNDAESDAAQTGTNVESADHSEKVTRSRVVASEHESSSNSKEVSTTIVETLLANLSADINMQFSVINERMDRLEAGLEKRITQKVTQVLDKRVSTEMSKIKKVVEEQIGAVKSDITAEFRADFKDVSSKLEQVSEKVSGTSISDNIALNIVLRDLPEQINENTIDKVNKLIKNGLKVADVECCQAVRKGRNSHKNRVIIASLSCHEDKRKVMIQKKALKGNSQYSKVYINHDQPLGERIMADNFRTVLHALREHGLVVQGSRVVRRDGRNQRANQHPHHRQDRQYSGGDQRQNRAHSGNRDNSASVNANNASVFRVSHQGSSSDRPCAGQSYANATRGSRRESPNGDEHNSQQAGDDTNQHNRRPNYSAARGRGTRNNRGRGSNNYQRRDF